MSGSTCTSTLLRGWTTRLVIVAMGLLLLSGVASAADFSVALPKVSGPKKAVPSALFKGAKVGLSSAGVGVVSGKTLARGARLAGAPATSPEAAKAAGASFVVVVTVKKAGRSFLATGRLIRAADGEESAKYSKKYKGKKGASKAGKAIGRTLGKKAVALFKKGAVGPLAAAEPDEPEDMTPPPTGPVAPVVPEPTTPPAGTTPSTVTPKPDEPAEKVETDVSDRGRRGRGGEDKLLRISLGGGTQVASAYTVAVGEQVTGLAYSLGPLIMINGGVAFNVPGTEAQIAVDLALVPVKYQVDVEPPVEPNQPSGRYLSIGATALYRIQLARLSGRGRFTLAPVLGFSYDALSVQEQGENTVVLSWNALSAVGGLQLGLKLSDSLALEADGRGGLVVSYGESPKTTGDGGGGLVLVFGGGARYWLSSALGIYLKVSYDYYRVGLSGAGTRTPFLNDPPLTDATVFNGQLRAGLGLMLAI